MIEIVRYTQRNVKRWQDGDMRKRWTAAGMLVAEQQFRRIIGYRDLATLVIAIERHALIAAPNNLDRQETRRARYRLTVNPEDRRRSSTTIRTSSAGGRRGRGRYQSRRRMSSDRELIWMRSPICWWSGSLLRHRSRWLSPTCPRGRRAV